MYDVIVIGGGHAGCEAIAAASRLGAKSALITHEKQSIGRMSCNPAIGGIAKGTIVREVDALDGLMGKVIDKAGIHYKMLNRSKGPAVWGPRAQADRFLYAKAMQEEVLDLENVDIIEDEALKVLHDNNLVKGVLCKGQGQILSKAVVVTTGTFLNGLMHIGSEKTEGGREGASAAKSLSDSLQSFGLSMSRLKTGTPARLVQSTINFDQLELQKGDATPEPFSYLNDAISVPQIPCYITYTNENTHNIISKNIHLSAMYSGDIESLGPRYCPSIEDKINRFADKNRHQIFLEPEGLDDDTVYPNGISTSLPEHVQDKFIRSIKGLENVEIKKYGYAVEYDYVDPKQLDHSLSVKNAQGLYLAGQINGTTGYEEAAGQGLVAGANAAKYSISQDSFAFDRSEAYIGVMIDDLVNFGTKEPYRMFTSRAEYRLSLRADNADQRLTRLGHKLKLVTDARLEVLNTKLDEINRAKEELSSFSITPNKAADYNIKLSRDGTKRTALDLIVANKVDLQTIEEIWPKLSVKKSKILQQVIIEATYAGYLSKQNKDMAIYKLENKCKIPDNFNYSEVKSLSNEVMEKLAAHSPKNIGAAVRISGVTPAALSALYFHLKKKKDV